MNAIISLLPEPFYHQVEETWSLLEEKFGVSGVRIAPFPHFSWQGALEYEEKGLDLTMKTIANLSKPFHVRTSGIGVFTGPHPVIYIEVIKSPRLMRIHQQIWSALRPLGKDFNPYYEADWWQPHITLAMGDVPSEMIGPIVSTVAPLQINWDFLVDNVALFVASGESGIIKQKYAFNQ